MRRVLFVMFVFQSTLPLRGVTADKCTSASPPIFQSTLPLRGVTKTAAPEIAALMISIHTPLAGSDRRNETFLTK